MSPEKNVQDTHISSQLKILHGSLISMYELSSVQFDSHFQMKLI